MEDHIMQNPMLYLIYSVMRKRGKKALKKFEDACEIADTYTEELLMRLINDAKDSEYGKKYHFDQIHSIEDYKRLVPISQYDDYEPYIMKMYKENVDDQLTGRHCVQFALTSGSTGLPKLIPVVQDVIDLYSDMGCSRTFALGSRYLKEHNKKFPYYKCLNLIEVTDYSSDKGKKMGAISETALERIKPFFKYVSTSPDEIIFPKEKIDLKYLKLLFALREENICFIASAFTTVVADLFVYLSEHWESLVEDIKNGTISKNIEMSAELRKTLTAKLKPDPKRANELKEEFEKGFDTPILPRIWPRCSWIGAIGTGTFEPYTEIMRRYVGNDIAHDNLLYAASESIFAACPEMNSSEFAMIPQSGFYEFVPAEDDDLSHTLNMNELEIGKEYELIVTNLSGFYRYRMYDVVKVLGFKGKSPLIRFVYRKNQVVNLVGEKTNAVALAAAVEAFGKEIGCNIVEYSVYPDVSNDSARYCFVIEPEHELDVSKCDEYAEIMERKLGECNMPFQYAVETGELKKSTLVIVQSQTYQLWRELQIAKGILPNQIKPVRLIDTPEKEKFFMGLKERNM